jgi:hypothetical protein
MFERLLDRLYGSSDAGAKAAGSRQQDVETAARRRGATCPFG